MVEYAYCYPRYYLSGASEVVNLDNIKNDSLTDYAMIYTFDGSIYLNIMSFEPAELPENAEIVDEYFEVAADVIYKREPSQINCVVNSHSEVLGSFPITTTFKSNKIITGGFEGAVFRFNHSDYTSGDFEVRLYYVRLVVEYNLPKFALSCRRGDNNNLVNDETLLNVNIININQTKHKPNVLISLPEGVELVYTDKSVQSSENNIIWRPNGNDNLNLRFRLLTVGVKLFSVTESYDTSTVRRISFVVSENIEDDIPEETVDGIPISIIKEGNSGLDGISNTINRIGYESVSITVRCDNAILECLDYITFTDKTGLCGTITPHTSADFIDNTTVFDIIPGGAGSTDLQIEYQLTVGGVSTVYKAQHYLLNVLPDTLTYPFFTVLRLTDEELCRLGDHINYTVQTYMKIINGDIGFGINDWIKNYRIGVYNPESVPDDFDITELTLEEIFDGVVEWSGQPSKVGEYDNIECTFTYHKGNPLYIVVTGDYEEGNINSVIDYSTPVIIETSVYNGYEDTGNYPVPITCLVDGTGAVGSVTITRFSQSTPVVLDGWELPDGFGTNDEYGVTGVEFNMGCAYNDSAVVNVRLVSPTGKYGQRSVVIDEGVNNIKFGGPYDTFGFDVPELVNLEDFEIEVQVNNPFNNIANLRVYNATLTFYFNQLTNVLVDTFIDGVDIRYYGLFLEEVEMPEGLETDTKYLEIEGADSHSSYRQNIDKKEIKLKLSVNGCNIYDTSEMIRNITKLFQNKRDNLNKPIPKRIEFSTKPDVYFEYILEDSIGVDFESANSELEIKLVIPSGTAFAKEETITSVTGVVTGIAKVNPIIELIPLGDHVEIVETLTGQQFNMNYTRWSSDTTVRIDCNQREVTVISGDDEIDISEFIDFTSDWFILDGEYIFESTNCIIQSVTFTERW